MSELEMCISCDGATGRAGRGDDSLYCPVCDKGPYCDACWYDHCLECYSSELSRLRAENERLRAVLDGAGYKNIDNLKNESVDKCTFLGLTAKLLTEREIKARVDMTDEAARLRADLAAALKTIERVREWKQGNGGLRTEYIDWEDLEALLTEGK